MQKFLTADVAKAIADSAGSSPAVSPRYVLKSYRWDYRKLGGDGKQVLALALVNVPIKPAGVTSPVLALQHGTNYRDAETPSSEVAASKQPVVLASSLSLRALTTTWPTTRRPSTRKAMCMTGGLWCIHRCSMGGTYKSSSTTLQAMQAQGAGSSVSLTDC